MVLRWENIITGEKGYFKNGIRDEKYRVTYKRKINRKNAESDEGDNR